MPEPCHKLAVNRGFPVLYSWRKSTAVKGDFDQDYFCITSCIDLYTQRLDTMVAFMFFLSLQEIGSQPKSNMNYEL